ncbi:MAG: hypothetical protein U0470_10065 [Anaerolineae bacterium]
MAVGACAEAGRSMTDKVMAASVAAAAANDRTDGRTRRDMWVMMSASFVLASERIAPAAAVTGRSIGRREIEHAAAAFADRPSAGPAAPIIAMGREDLFAWPLRMASLPLDRPPTGRRTALAADSWS